VLPIIYWELQQIILYRGQLMVFHIKSYLDTRYDSTDLAKDYFLIAIQAEFIALMLQPLVLGLVKISIIFFYRRIFCTGKRTVFSVFSAGFIGLTIIWSLGFFLAVVLTCGSDPAAQWGTYDEFKTHCDNTILFDEVYTIIDFILDFVVLLMPIPLVWGLQMSTKRRILVLLVFLLGAL
jgi:hypothetical protein